MKKAALILLVITTFLLIKLKAQTTGTFSDARDNKTYKTVTIGLQTWMAENLNFITKKSWCYKNNANDCNVYGRLYNWKAARKACPNGWHLPNKNEWQSLIVYLGGEDKAGGKMKESGSVHWKSPNTGATDESGFNALPAGYWFYNDASFRNEGSSSVWWSASKSVGAAWYCYMVSDKTIADIKHDSKHDRYSVRCLKDY